MSDKGTFRQRERMAKEAMEQPVWILAGRTIQADDRAHAKALR